jgi:hypothetical protein
VEKISVGKVLQAIAFGGNLFFILWIVYNGIDEGFQGSIYQILSYIGLVLLLILNSVLVMLGRYTF